MKRAPYTKYSDDKKVQAADLLTDPTTSHLKVGEIARRVGLPAHEVSRVKHKLSQGEQITAKSKGRPKGSFIVKQVATSRPTIQLSHQQICDIRNMTVIGASLNEVARELNLDPQACRDEYRRASEEMKQGTMSTDLQQQLLVNNHNLLP
jgi:transposase-like protein